METSSLPEPLRTRLQRLDATPALETARGFLGTVVGDAGSLDELRADLTRLAQTDTRSHHRYLDALETVLAEPQPPGTLRQLVEGYGNWSLDDDPTDAAATAFLTGLTRMLRTVIAEAEHPRP